MPKYEIHQTETYKKWRSSLKDGRTRAAIALRVERLACGNAGDVKPVGGGVSELRIDHGPGYRVYFKKHGKVLIILLCGGDKSTQENDIRRAKRLAEGL
jgi:putative addiction module killer protein